MKLITAIVNKDDGSAVQSGLTSKGFAVTRIATTGGFLMSGNVTFIIGVEDDKVDEAIGIISELAKKRKQLVPPTASYGMGVTSAYPIELMMGGATVFVQDVERFEKM
jgi:Uncharacterized protein conserved in bacteria